MKESLYKIVGKDGGKLIGELADGTRHLLNPDTMEPIKAPEKVNTQPYLDQLQATIDTQKRRIGDLEAEGAQKDARLAKAQSDLTAAKDELDTANARIKELESEAEETAATEGSDDRETQLRAQQAAAAGETVADDLKSIDGVDEEIAKALADAGFDTFDKIKAASEADLEKVSGIGKATAKKIKAHFV